MRWQQEEIMKDDDLTPVEVAQEAKDEAPAETAVIAVASGDGIAKLLKSLGVTHVITGGQTMNPSIQDIADAINQSGAKQALVLPDNGNIFMAADQAAEVAEIPVKIVHAKTIAQAMSALLEYNPEASLEDNQAAMENVLGNVASGEVTVAVRDTQLNGKTIKKDDYMGIVDGEIVAVEKTIEDAAEAMVTTMLDADSEIVTILYGADGDQTGAETLKEKILAQDDELDVQIYEGDQPVYPYLISVE